MAQTKEQIRTELWEQYHKFNNFLHDLFAERNNTHDRNLIENIRHIVENYIEFKLALTDVCKFKEQGVNKEVALLFDNILAAEQVFDKILYKWEYRIDTIVRY